MEMRDEIYVTAKNILRLRGWPSVGDRLGLGGLSTSVSPGLGAGSASSAEQGSLVDIEKSTNRVPERSVQIGRQLSRRFSERPGVDGRSRHVPSFQLLQHTNNT